MKKQYVLASAPPPPHTHNCSQESPARFLSRFYSSESVQFLSHSLCLSFFVFPLSIRSLSLTPYSLFLISLSVSTPPHYLILSFPLSLSLNLCLGICSEFDEICFLAKEKHQ